MVEDSVIKPSLTRLVKLETDDPPMKLVWV